MEYKEKVLEALKEKGIIVLGIEQEGDTRSIVCHINKSDTSRIDEIKEELEKKLDSIIISSDMYGMNVLIVEDKNLE
jgi:hypothetical protein